MTDYQCKSCHKLLFQGVYKSGSLGVFIKCSKCKTINEFTGVSQVIDTSHNETVTVSQRA